jgi:hypothetical protein
MKALKTIMTSAAAILATSTASLAFEQTTPGTVMTDHFEAALNRMVDGIQTAVGLDFLSREGFYVVAGLAAILVLFLTAKVMRAAQDADELAKQRRVVRARKQAEAEYEAQEARRQKRRFGS